MNRTDINLSEARQRLWERRAQLVGLRQAQKRDKSDLLEPEPGDIADLGSEEEAKDLLEQLGESEFREVRQIDEALARIESGEYGVCQGCGEPINERRLQVIPETDQCIQCADQVTGGAA